MGSTSPITQVTKEDIDRANSSLIAGQKGASVTHHKSSIAESNKKEKPGLLKLLCCCFISPVPDKSPYKKQSISNPPNNPTPINNDRVQDFLLPPQTQQEKGKKTLVLDLDETLVHSSFKPIPNADFIIPVEIDNQIHQVYVVKRPGVDQFLKTMAARFELVVFTASLAKYADPVLDLLDKDKVVGARLFREACSNHKGNYVKDLSRLGRELKSVIIVDNSPASYMFHPENAVPIDSWFDDENDTELLDLIPFLEDMTQVENVMTVLDTSHRG